MLCGHLLPCWLPWIFADIACEALPSDGAFYSVGTRNPVFAYPGGEKHALPAIEPFPRGTVAFMSRDPQWVPALRSHSDAKR